MKVWFLPRDPRFTPHEVKWGEPWGDTWIEAQDEMKTVLEQKTAGLSKEAVAVVLRNYCFDFYERDNGDLVVWLDGAGSREQNAVRELEKKLAKSLESFMAKACQTQCLLNPPSKERVTQMAKASADAARAAAERLRAAPAQSPARQGGGALPFSDVPQRRMSIGVGPMGAFIQM